METGLGEMPDRDKISQNFGRSGMSEGEFQSKNESSESGSEETLFKGARPDFRVVQTEYNSKLGKTLFKDVGAMWRGVSKSGNEFYTLKIGKLRLLVFHNNKD